MGSGLIWAGIGKGIADAGQTFGNAMMRSADAEEQERREALREQRLLERQEALDRLKAERDRTREEELQQRVIKESGQVATRASEIGAAREGKAFDKLAESSALAGEQGDVALSKEQLQKLAKDDPALGEQYKKMGLIDAAMPLTRNQARMQRAEDEVQAGMDIGAHSSVQKSLQDKRTKVLDEIRVENAERKEENRTAEERAREERRSREEERRDREGRGRAENDARRADATAVQARAAERRAAAAEARAGRPGSDPSSKPATTADIQRQINAAKDDIAMTLGATKTEVNAAIASLQKRAGNGDAKAKEKLAEIQPFLDEVKDANERMRQFKRPAKEETSSGGKGGDNGNVKGGESSASSSAKPAVDSKTPPKIEQVQGAPSGSTIGSFVTGKGWEVRDKSGRVVGHIR